MGTGQGFGHLLRLLINIILLFVIVETVRSLRRGGGGLFRKLFSRRKRATEAAGRQAPAPDDYSKITPYEIEDADFEEIREVEHHVCKAAQSPPVREVSVEVRNGRAQTARVFGLVVLEGAGAIPAVRLSANRHVSEPRSHARSLRRSGVVRPPRFAGTGPGTRRSGLSLLYARSRKYATTRLRFAKAASNLTPSRHRICCF